MYLPVLGLVPYKKEQLEIHGNPNVLTGDIPTSSLSQAPSAHTTLVEVKKCQKNITI